MTRRRTAKFFIPLALVGALIASVMGGFATPATAASPVGNTVAMAAPATTGFQAGNIISDAVFFNSSTMNAAQIQSFMNSQVSSCQPGYTCLKDYRQTTTTMPADRYCNGYTGAANESSATIIYNVAQSCGINPQVFLVMLQKEQSLVTSTWPAAWRYNAALGQGCPDTAPCDPNFVGFFFQVYGAGRQLKSYINSTYFTWYAPGKTWNILYNPNRACGSAPVYVQNAATSALYYYTPYQPNAAALRAGYGTGDSCSAYGNRNFYNYFVDWFGSTQTMQPQLITAPGQGAVYLVDGGYKHHVLTALDMLAYQASVGNLQYVSAATVNSIPEGAPATRYIQDTRTGTLYLLDADGTKHRFPTADLVSVYGYSFNSYLNLSGTLVDRYQTGGEVSPVFRPSGSTDAYLYSNGVRRHVYNGDALLYAQAGGSTYVATMEATQAANIPIGPALFVPNMLVREQSSGDVFLTTATGTIVHIPSFALAADFGATMYRVVPDGELSHSTTAKTDLSPAVSCSGILFILDRGALRPVSGQDVGSLTPLALSQAECAQFRTAGSAVTAPLFVQPVGSGDVDLVDHGVLRHVQAYTDLMTLNGNRPLTLLSWSADTASTLISSAPVLSSGTFVQFSGLPEVYLAQAGQLRHITSYARLLALGGGVRPPILSMPASTKPTYTIGADLT